jgi:hypothetical protein
MTKVLTQDEIYKIECAIWNDDNKSLFDTLPTSVEGNPYQESIKALAKNKEYYIVPDTDIMLVEDGGLYNVKFVRRLKPLWTPHDLLINGKGKQHRYSDIFLIKGWEWNHKEVCRNFIKYDWAISITYGYKDKYRDFISEL